MRVYLDFSILHLIIFTKRIDELLVLYFRDTAQRYDDNIRADTWNDDGSSSSALQQLLRVSERSNQLNRTRGSIDDTTHLADGTLATVDATIGQLQLDRRQRSQSLLRNDHSLFLRYREVSLH